MTASIRDLADGELSVITGTVHDLTERITRQGRTWASASLTCGGETVELLVFPVPYEQLRHLLAEGGVVSLACRMDGRDDTPRLMAHIPRPGSAVPPLQLTGDPR